MSKFSRLSALITSEGSGVRILSLMFTSARRSRWLAMVETLPGCGRSIWPSECEWIPNISETVEDLVRP